MVQHYLFLVLLNLWCVNTPDLFEHHENPQKNYITVKDHKIYYETSGNGSPVLLIHGGYLDHTMWDKQVKFLNKRGYMTIRFDDMGHVKSISGIQTIFGHEIVRELLETLKIDEVCIVGLSWGSMIAVDFALQFPDKAKKLILLSPGLSGWEYFKDKAAKRNFEQRQIAKKNNDKKAFVEYFQKNWTDGPQSDSLRIGIGIRQQIEHMIQYNATHHWNKNWSELMVPPDIGRLSDLKAETLIVTGNLDALDIHMIAEKFNSSVENSKWIKISNVTHTLNLEKPLKLNKILLRFLDNQP